MSDGVATETIGIKGEVQVLEPDRGERAVARRSAESRATIPTVEYASEVDVDALLAREAELGSGMSALLLRAVARGLRAVPRINGAYRDGRFERYGRLNVGFTVAAPDLYVIPTVFDVDEKTVAELALEVADLRAKALAHELAPSEVTGATFTLTDTTTQEVATLTPLVVAPQAAALAAGPIRDLPVVRGGAVVPGHTMSLHLACDHRIVYGVHATAFLGAVGAHLEEGMC